MHIEQPLVRRFIVICPAFCALTSALLALVHPLHAAPFTLHFSATIGSVGDLWMPPHPVDPPIDFALGGKITGSLTFDPAIVHGPPEWTNQSYDLHFRAGGVDLVTHDFSPIVMNDRSTSITVMCDCGYTGPVSPDPIIYSSYLNFYSDDPSPFADPPSEDRIDITRYLGHSYSEEFAVPGHEVWQWQPLMTLTGGLNVIDDNYLPTDVAIWNSFTTKSLSLGFVTLARSDHPNYPVYRKTLVVNAEIDRFSIVPEPSSLLICLIGFAWVTISRATKGHQYHFSDSVLQRIQTAERTPHPIRPNSLN